MVDADIDGSKIDTFGPRSGLPVPGGTVGGVVGAVPPGSVHCWLAPPVQLQICSWLPLAELQFVASRHFPEPVLTRAPPDTVHFWAFVPLQSYSWILVPLAVPAAVTSMHLPSAWIELSELPTVQFCAFVPLQS